MKTSQRETESELSRNFEPLRTTFAVLALLLGLIAGLHF